MSTNLKYPYQWGKTPVNAFVEKYARGTYYLAHILDISPGDVRHKLILTVCSGRSVQFESVKRVIKTLESYTWDQVKRFSATDKKLLYKYLVWFAQDSVLDENITKKGLDSFRN